MRNVVPSLYIVLIAIRRPNRLIVDEASSDDNSGELLSNVYLYQGDSTEIPTVATMNPATMETLQLFRGDTIIVRYVCVMLQ